MNKSILILAVLVLAACSNEQRVNVINRAHAACAGVDNEKGWRWDNMQASPTVKCEQVVRTMLEAGASDAAPCYVGMVPMVCAIQPEGKEVLHIYAQRGVVLSKKEYDLAVKMNQLRRVVYDGNVHLTIHAYP